MSTQKKRNAKQASTEMELAEAGNKSSELEMKLDEPATGQNESDTTPYSILVHSRYRECEYDSQ